MDDRTTGESPHELLLALAGRIDDDLLAWCRELVAVGEDARALELLTATLIADRTPLPPAERAALVRSTRTARTDLGADAALAPAAAEDDTAHRFDAELPGVDHVVAALGALPARQVAGLRTWVTMRVTPAGSAPGPLPHPVVLVEVGADDPRPVDVLAYQLAIACARAGADAAVEVVVAGAARPRYQQAALRSARLVHGAADPAAARSAQEVRVAPVPYELLSPGSPEPALLGTSGPDTEILAVQQPPVEERRPAPAAEIEHAGGAVVVPARPRPASRRSGAQPDDEAVAAFRAASGLPGPADEPSPGYRSPSPGTSLRGQEGPPPAPVPAVTLVPRSVPSPVARRGLTPVGDPPSPGPQPFPDSPPPSVADPLNGPTDEQADLEARDEPTIDENDPLGLGMLPVAPAQPPVAQPPVAQSPVAQSPVAQPDDARPEPAPVADPWLAEWTTGDWAMSPSVLSDPHGRTGARSAEPAAAGQEGEEPEGSASTDSARSEVRGSWTGQNGSRGPRSGRRRASASRQAFPVPEQGDWETSILEPAAESPPVEPPPVAAGVFESPAVGSPLDQSGFILRPESVARLSDADRDLLARLQAELDEVPRTPVGRRVGIEGAGTEWPGSYGRYPGPPDTAG